MGAGPEVRSSNAHPTPTQVTYMSNMILIQLRVVRTVANWRVDVPPKGQLSFSPR